MFRKLAMTVWAPNRAFEDIQKNPTWLGAFLLIGIGSAFVSYTTLPIFQKIYLISITDSLNPEQLDSLHHSQRIMRYFFFIGTLLGTLFFWFISAFLIWLIIQVFEGRGRFKPIFSVVSHASLTSLISSVLVATFVHFKSSKGFTDLQNLEIKFGADLFVGDTVHPVLQVLLANINPFTFWYYALLTIGIAIVCECNRTKAFAAVGTLWGISMAFGASIAWIVSTFQTSMV